MEKKRKYFIRDQIILFLVFALVLVAQAMGLGEYNPGVFLQNQNGAFFPWLILLTIYVLHVIWVAFWGIKSKPLMVVIPWFIWLFAGFWLDKNDDYETIRYIALISGITGVIIVILWRWYKDRLVEMKTQA